MRVTEGQRMGKAPYKLAEAVLQGSGSLKVIVTDD